MILKKCNLCNEEKEEDKEFYFAKGGPLRMGRCKECHKKYQRAWYKLHKQKIDASNAAYGFIRKGHGGRNKRPKG